MFDGSNPFARFWMTPVVLGLLLILLGLLLINHPELLAYFVAGLFMLAGVALVGMGWALRGRVRYRRLDPTWEDEPPHE